MDASDGCVRSDVFNCWSETKDLFGKQYSFQSIKFENFGTGNPSSCTWRILSLDLIAENVLADVPDFTYESSITICKHTEISEVIPENGDRFMNFRVSPSLPSGLVLDRYSGWISGTALDEYTVTIYTIIVTKMM